MGDGTQGALELIVAEEDIMLAVLERLAPVVIALDALVLTVEDMLEP